MIPVPEVEVPDSVQDQQDGAFFFLTNLWSKNYNRRKEGILTNFDILMSCFRLETEYSLNNGNGGQWWRRETEVLPVRKMLLWKLCKSQQKKLN